MKRLFDIIKKSMFAGVIFWAPLIITVLVVKFIIHLAVELYALIPLEYLPKTSLLATIPGLDVACIILIILLSGWMLNQYIGKVLLSHWEGLLKRIPIIRTIHRASKQSIETLINSNTNAFNRVVLVEYPRRDMWSIAFITNDKADDFAAGDIIGHEFVSVYVPTTPNPTSGFIILVPIKDVYPVNLTTEEALRWIISLGLVSPKESNSGKIQ